MLSDWTVVDTCADHTIFSFHLKKPYRTLYVVVKACSESKVKYSKGSWVDKHTKLTAELMKLKRTNPKM
ncbi:hypothetical protein AV530_007700 [Patagioenas fasciata monilis]|uniref:Uncharacterized protein n=1 Tax=Patagioenas fasciata monilis TaxID=372326 RepID=A0A1V4JYY5_PATFA|nr:hypothetical protein AV530_007700 [Patagioenas fasciata monilis]